MKTIINLENELHCKIIYMSLNKNFLLLHFTDTQQKRKPKLLIVNDNFW